MFNKIVSTVIRQYIIIITVCFTLVCSGMGLAWPSPMLVKLRNTTETVLAEPITDEQGSWVVSIGFLVGALMNFTPPLLLDRIGRKYSIILGILPKAIGAFFLLFATKVWMLILIRALNGVSDMFIFTVVPTYASEISSKEIRGSLSTIIQVMFSLGLLMMYSIGPFVSYMAVNILNICLIVAALIPVFFLPESPFFLYIKDRPNESVKILTLLRGSEAVANEELNEYALINNGEKVKTTILFRNKIFWKSLCMAVVILVGSQILGHHAVSFYLQTILESTQTSVSPEISSVIIGVVQLVASLFTAVTTDRFGRKPILSTSLLGMTVGMICLGVFFFVTEGADAIVGFMNFLPLIAIVLVVVCFSTGPGSLNWAVTAELFDNNGRTVGLSICQILSGIATFIVTRFFPAVVFAIGPAITYWIFSLNCLLLCAIIVFIIPETKGKSFIEIQRKIGAKIDDEEKEGK